MTNDLSEQIKTNSKKIVKFYVFERVDTKYFDTNGVEKIYKRTTRVDKREELSKVVEMLDSCSKSYLLHRYRVVNDNVHWARLLMKTNQPILWLDYSRNINFKEKCQVQSAHFSGKQQTLHCSLLINPDGSNKYIYHISDDTNHDSTLTFEILNDILNKHEYLAQNNILIIRSDNCEDQYKCKYTFFQMKKLAKLKNLIILWFYGAPGHGRGLVDAMSSFGCKQPLRRHILATDKWFATAYEMVEYLKKHFKERHDNTKEHYHVDESVTASKRQKEKEEFVMSPCRAYHLIAVNNDGEFKKLLYYKGEELQSIFSDTQVDSANVVPEVEYAEEDGFLLDTNTVAELVQPGTFIAVRSPSNAIECFFLCEVIETDIAKCTMSDDGGHIVVKGERYAKVLYLQKKSESKKHAKYERPQKQTETLIHIAEVFATNILVDANLKMDIGEYQSILSAAL